MRVFTSYSPNIIRTSISLSSVSLFSYCAYIGFAFFMGFVKHLSILTMINCSLTEIYLFTSETPSHFPCKVGQLYLACCSSILLYSHSVDSHRLAFIVWIQGAEWLNLIVKLSKLSIYFLGTWSLHKTKLLQAHKISNGRGFNAAFRKINKGIQRLKIKVWQILLFWP